MSDLFAPNDLSDWETMEDGVTVEAPDDADVTVTVPAPAEIPATVTVETTDDEPEEEAPDEDTPDEEAAEADPVAAELEALKARVAEQEKMIGRQSAEVKEAREIREQIERQVEALQQQPSPIGDWDQLLDDDPAAAYQHARAARDVHRTQQAKQAWNDLSPGAPDLYEQNQFLYGKLTDLEQRFTQTTEPMQQQQASRQIAEVTAAVSQQYDDFDNHGDAMQNIIETRPLMKAMFEKVVREGTPEEQFAYIDDLYKLASGRKADTLKEAATKVAQEHAAETLRAKQEAQVASASANMDTGQTRSPSEQIADRIGAEWEEIKKPYVEGWNISSG